MSDSFIHEIPLKTAPRDEAVLDVRLDAARNLYNACLGESLRRLDLMRESKAYQLARTLPKIVTGKPNKERLDAFKACSETHRFQEYDLHAFAGDTAKACWIGDHLDAFTIQKVATRAFNSVKQYSFGNLGRPRFKRFGWFSSVEGKSNTSGIRWREGKVIWSGLELQPIFDPQDKHGVEAHALKSRIKYLRLVKRTIKGKACCYVQLVLEGQPLQKDKNKITEKTTGLDIGPSTIAIVGEDGATLAQFCNEVVQPWKEIMREQRAQDRSRRATNPENYNPDGTAKKGSKKWIRSNRYKKRQAKIAELQRKLAATRKKQHGELCNKTLSLGKFVKAEKLSYKSFQKNFGRSVQVRAPGMFIALLTRKAENAGGSVEGVNTRSTKLSQTCICGAVKKKPLSQRTHSCPECGTTAQRDLFSAHLARHCSDNKLDICQAKSAWPAAEPLLRRAISRLEQTANRGCLPASFGILRRQSCSPVKNGSPLIEAVDDVVAGNGYESHGEINGFAVRTPWL